MTFIKQPELYQAVPIKLEKVGFRGDTTGYRTSVGSETYVWTERKTPAGEKIWTPVESTSIPESVELAEYKNIPEELYEAIKQFYYGKTKKVYRGH